MKQKNVILMVVAVGCGLVAAFLTSQMSGKTVEQVEVVVAAKDLPVGTMITRADLEKSVKMKKVPKDGLPPAIVTNPEELVDKRLSRPVRAEETFNSQDLSKGGAITLPEGHDMVSLPLGAGQGAAGFVGPGSRVDVIATIRQSNKLIAFKLLVNMLVLAVNTETVYTKDGTFPNMSMVSFAVKDKEALLLALAKNRGCSLELQLRNPNKPIDADYKIDDVIKLMSEEKNKTDVQGGTPEAPPKETTPPAPTKPEPTPAPTKPEPTPAPAPTIKMVQVLTAKEFIAPNTLITNDLLKTSFEWKDLPKDSATDALTDFSDVLGRAFKTGVAKGQWITTEMIGEQQSKVSPQETFNVPKPEAKPEPTTPTAPTTVPTVKRKTHDLAVRGPSGTVIHRYEEVAPGQWKKVKELTEEQVAAEEKADSTPPAPASGK